MKKVAVIGCSHSSNKLPGITSWTWLLQNDCIVHNYAKSGHGSLYYDMVLKYIMSENLKYDAIIVQRSGSGRWMLPLTGMSSHRFVETVHNENYSTFDCDVTRKILASSQVADHLSAKSPWIKDNFQSNPKKLNLEFHPYGEDETNLASYYDELFYKTLPASYSHLAEHIFQFSLNNDNTIGMDHPPLPMILRKSTSIDEVLDETDHLTTLGNSILYNDYILKSKIGDYIKG